MDSWAAVVPHLTCAFLLSQDGPWPLWVPIENPGLSFALRDLLPFSFSFFFLLPFSILPSYKYTQTTQGTGTHPRALTTATGH